MEYSVHVPATDNVALPGGRVDRAHADCNSRDGCLSRVSLVTLDPDITYLQFLLPDRRW